MKVKSFIAIYSQWIRTVFLAAIFCLVSTSVLWAQTADSMTHTSSIKPLRSDVGIIGFTANFNWLNSYKNLSQTNYQKASNHELEIKVRDVRMMMPRLGVGFQVLASFFANKKVGVGSWGIGPVVRAYPFKTNRIQPYIQAEALFGKNLAVGKLSDTKTGGKGFRVRLGLRGGVAIRLSNEFGIFADVGPDWESGALFKADARAIQANIGFDIYRFK